MGLALLLGFIFLVGGLSLLGGTCILLYFAINNKKPLFYIFTALGFVLSFPAVAIGIYVIYDFLNYLKTL